MRAVSAREAAAVPLTPGSRFGPYRIIEPLGRGGMASVHRAYEAGLDRYVALKVLPAEFMHDTSFAERFRREARVIARLEHPNIIPIYAFGIDEGIPWMAMRLVSGGTLAGLLTRGRVDQRLGVAVVGGVAAALDYAHVQGVLHRDVKPQNVLLDEAHHVYLADFGIARMVEGSTVLTGTGLITGTPQYMAPEQARGVKNLDARCDIYALGIVAYEVLTGRLPFTADTPVAVLMKHILEPLPVPPASEIAEPLTRALLKCLSKAPDDRWPTAAAFVRALEAGLAVAATRDWPTVPTKAAATLSHDRDVGVTRPAPTPRPRAPETRRATASPNPVEAGGSPVRRWLVPAVLVSAAVVLGSVEVVKSRRRAAPTMSPPATVSPTSAAVPRGNAVYLSSPSVTPTRPESTVAVHANVAAARLTIDGRDAGAIPAEVKLPPGRHLVEAVRAGCTPARIWLDLESGERERVDLDIQCATPSPATRLAAATPEAKATTIATPVPTRPPVSTALATPAPQASPSQVSVIVRHDHRSAQEPYYCDGTLTWDSERVEFRSDTIDSHRFSMPRSRGCRYDPTTEGLQQILGVHPLAWSYKFSTYILVPLSIGDRKALDSLGCVY